MNKNSFGELLEAVRRSLETALLEKSTQRGRERKREKKIPSWFKILKKNFCLIIMIVYRDD